MAELLAQWINEEVGLSKKVTNFEEDFASGYLLGELLYKFNQQPDFQNFSTKNATSHFVMNFEKLEPTLRSLHVQFNSKTVEQIMSRERGLALRLLYQLKMVLEKVYPPADISIVAKTGTFGDNQPAQRIAHSKPKYDQVSNTFFKQRLAKLNRAQKDIDLEAHLKKYDEEMQRQADEAAKLDNNDVQEDIRKKQEMRRIQINKLQRNAGFMEEWLAKGVEDWKGNMQVKMTREATQLEFDFTQSEKYNKITQQKLQEAQDEVQQGIRDFEKNLKAQGISTKVSKEVADRAVTETLNGKPWQSSTVNSNIQAPELTYTKTFDQKLGTKKGNFTLTSTGLKQRTKKTVTDDQRKEREKRRRRLINKQSYLLVDLEQQTRENNVTELMKRQSHQEKELDYEAWRTTQCKNIIVENRKLRETQYERRKLYDVEISVQKEEKLIQEMQDASTREMSEMIKRTEELKVYEQQQKLLQRTQLCSQLMDKIFDIADEAYNHMQDLDSKEWDSRNWNNWLTLFVEQKQIAGSMSELLIDESAQSTAFNSEAQNQLDETDLVHFVKNGGQWPTTLVSDVKLNLAEILNPKVEVAATVKGGKPVGKAPVQAEIVLDEGDLEVTEKPLNNFIFGDVVDQLIKLHFPQRPDLKHPPTPNWLALKICLAGYPFSGKKTQAALIKEKYGLDTYIMEDLVNQAIKFATEGDSYGLDYQATAIKEDGSDYAGLSEDEQLQKDVNEEMHEIGNLINLTLLDGEEISDQLYVRLFICALRQQYAYKCPITKRKEIKEKASRQVSINRRLNEIAIEFSKDELPKKQRKHLVEEQSALEIELKEIDQLPTNGWVLVDFPCNYSQAKLLEEALSGYKPHEELEPTEREKEIKEALLLVQPHEQAETSKTLIPSGIDAIIWFDCPIDQCLKRSDARRFDSQDINVRYHVFDNQPPTNEAPLCERLLQLSEDNNSVSGLPDRFLAFDQSTSSMQRWLKQFGDESKDRQLLRVVSAQMSVDQVQEQVEGTINLILENRIERYLKIKDDLSSKISSKFDHEQKKLILDREILKDNSVSSIDAASHRISPALENTTSNKKGGKNEQTVAHAQVAVSVGQSVPNLGQDSVHSIKVINFSRSNVELEFRPVLIKLWQELSRNYSTSMKKIFRNIRRQRETSFKSRSITQQKFLTYLHRLDNKQEILEQFVRDFNQFSDDYPDLREDNNTKEELHQRCDVLSDELWEIVEERKEQNTDERKKIMEQGAAENGLEFLTVCAQQLMQTELDKFKISIQIIHDYYFTIEEKSTHEITGAITAELLFEGEDMPPIETIADGADNTKIENYNYPRLDKLLQQAIKQQVVPDVTQIQQSAAVDKKGGKAPPPKKPATVTEIESVAEESQYVKEMREAVKVEKSILRFRLVQIRNWAFQRLQEHRQQYITLFKKFEDWILVAQKTEMDTIEEMCSVIKQAIEEESKIQKELRIKFMDFTVDESTLNFINPPIPKLEALEEIHDDRFVIPQLQCLLQEFERISFSIGDLFQVREIANLLFSKIKNSVYIGGLETSLPRSWNTFGLSQIHQIIRNIDSKNSGYVNWRTLITYMILLRSKVPTAKDISRFEKSLGSSEVNIETFLKCKFWFEETETSKDRENSIEFDRVTMIKELLFRAHSNRGILSVGNFATILGQISARAANPDSATFYDVLFAKVKI